MLLALPFLLVGAAIAFFALVPTLIDGYRMESWEEGRATLERAELVELKGEDSTSYRVSATYTYEYDGREYRGHRVAIGAVADNIGDFQQSLGQELESALAEGRPVPVWIDPADPTQAVLNRDIRWGMTGLYLVGTLLFGGGGVLLFLAGLRPRRARVAASATGGDKPWLQRAEWAGEPEIASGARFGMYAAWIFAAFWNLVAIPVGFMSAGEFLEGNRLAVAGLLFPLAGVGLIAWALRETTAWRRFGRTPLRMDPWPGAVGGQVGGVLALRIPYDAALRCKVTLSCLYSYVSGSGKNRKRRERLVWQREGYAHTRPLAEGTELDILFDVEEGLPESDVHQEREYHLWRLLVEAELPGVDFVRSFEIPVFATGKHAQRVLKPSTSHPQALEARERSVQGVLDVRQLPDGVEVRFPALRHPGPKVAGLACGAFFFGAGLLAGGADIPLLLRLLFGATGAAIALGSAWSLFRALHLRIDHTGLSLRRRRYGAAARTGIVRARARHSQLERPQAQGLVWNPGAHGGRQADHRRPEPAGARCGGAGARAAAPPGRPAGGAGDEVAGRGAAGESTHG